MKKPPQSIPAPLSREDSLRLFSESALYKFQGREYNLLLTYRVIIEWERATDLSYFSDLGKALDRPTLFAMGTMLWCLLMNAGYQGTKDAVMEQLAEPRNFKAAFNAVLAAYGNARIQKELETQEGDEEDPPAATVAM